MSTVTTQAEVAPPRELPLLGVTPPVRAYLAEIWRRREFATAIAVGEMRSGNMDTVLGNAWHLLNPLLMVGVYYLIFGVIIDTTRGIDNFIAFLAVGVFSYHYTQKSITSGTNAIVANVGLIRAVSFPRGILPLATVLAQTLTFLPAVAVMLAVALVTGERPTASWALLVPVLLLQALFNLGGTFVAARATDHLRDVKNLLPFLFRILFYLSGVLYSVDAMVSDPLHRALFNLNPTYAFITLSRAALLDGSPDPAVLVSALVWTIVLLCGGFLYFRGGEQTYGRG